VEPEAIDKAVISSTIPTNAAKANTSSCWLGVLMNLRELGRFTGDGLSKLRTQHLIFSSGRQEIANVEFIALEC